MRVQISRCGVAVLLLLGSFLCRSFQSRAVAADDKVPSSYSPVVETETFDAVRKRMEGAKAGIEKKQDDLLNERYDLSDKPAKDSKMSRGKPIQEGVRVKLPDGVKSWQDLAAMSPEEIKEKGAWPKGFLPLPHPNHPEGGMVFPKPVIDEIKKQEGRELERFDLDYDVPNQFLPEYPPAIFLTTRPDHYAFDAICDRGAQQEDRWTWTPKKGEAGKYPFQIEVRDEENALIARAETTLIVTAADTGAGKPLSVLMIGDSLTHASVYPAQVLTLCQPEGNPKLSLVGSFQSAGVAEGVEGKGEGSADGERLWL